MTNRVAPFLAAAVLLVGLTAAPDCAAQAPQVMENRQTLPASMWDQYKDQHAGDYVVYSASGAESKSVVKSVDAQTKEIAFDMESAPGFVMRMILACTGPEPEVQPVEDNPEVPEYKMETTEGDESITAGGKSYDCHWIQTRMVMEAGESTAKVWYSKDVPVVGYYGDPKKGGIVKSESTGFGTTTTMEIVSFGRGE